MKRGPAVDRQRLAAPVAGQITRQRDRRVRLELAGEQAILRAQKRAHERGRAGIAGEVAGAVEGGNRVEIGRKQPTRLLADRSGDEPLNALAPFEAARRLRTVEIVAAGAGMGVDDAERRRLGAQVHQNADQDRMLDHIGKVAGVKGVAIIHGRNSWTQIHRLSK